MIEKRSRLEKLKEHQKHNKITDFFLSSSKYIQLAWVQKCDNIVIRLLSINYEKKDYALK
jgi:hypothetical protein